MNLQNHSRELPFMNYIKIFFIDKKWYPHLESCQNDPLPNSGITNVAMILRATTTMSQICDSSQEMNTCISPPVHVLNSLHEFNVMKTTLCWKYRLYGETSQVQWFFLFVTTSPWFNESIVIDRNLNYLMKTINVYNLYA